jgi:CTP:molybdopterin cytidylyltransferase MocA
MISAVVLAAGSIGQAEHSMLFLPIHGKPVLQWVLDGALSTSVVEVICVVRSLAAVRANITMTDSRLSWLVDYTTGAGQSSAVIAGVWAVAQQSDAVLFLAGRQPMVHPDLLNTLIDRFDTASAPIIAASFQGRLQYPALLRRELFPELLKLERDQSALDWIAKRSGRLEHVQWNEPMSFMDMDDEEYYERTRLLA